MNKRIKTSFWLPLLLLLSACIKNGPDPQPSTYMPITDQRLRDAATIKLGSYFVYQDSATGGIDSFVVTLFDTSSSYDAKDNTMNEAVGYRMADSVTGPGMFQVINMGAARSSINGDIYLNSNAECVFLTLPFANGKTIEYEHGTATCLNYNASYIVLGKSYNDVYQIRSVNTNLGPVVNTWYSLGQGLVRFSIENGNTRRTYQLKRSKIVR